MKRKIVAFLLHSGNIMCMSLRNSVCSKEAKC